MGYKPKNFKPQHFYNQQLLRSFYSTDLNLAHTKQTPPPIQTPQTSANMFAEKLQSSSATTRARPRTPSSSSTTSSPPRSGRPTRAFPSLRSSAPSRCSSASKASKVPSTAPPTKHSRPNSAPARRKKLSSRSSRREPCKRLRVWPDKAPRTTAWVPAPATKRLAPLHPLLPHWRRVRDVYNRHLTWAQEEIGILKALVLTFAFDG